MGVNHRRAHILVAQQLLDRPNVIPILQQVGSKRMQHRAIPPKAGKGQKLADEDRFQIVGVSGRLGAEHTDRTGAGGDCHEKGDYSEEGEK